MTIYGHSMSCDSKDLIKMHPISCTNTPHDFTDMVNLEMVRKTKTWISWEWDRSFPQIKKLITCASVYSFWDIIVL